jgi:hypothetical protein
MWEIGDQCATFHLDPCLVIGLNPTSWAGAMWRRSVWRQWKWSDRRLNATYQKPTPKPARDETHYRTERLFTFAEAIGLKVRKDPADVRNVRHLLELDDQYDDEGNPVEDWLAEDELDLEDTPAESDGWPGDDASDGDGIRG